MRTLTAVEHPRSRIVAADDAIREILACERLNGFVNVYPAAF